MPKLNLHVDKDQVLSGESFQFYTYLSSINKLDHQATRLNTAVEDLIDYGDASSGSMAMEGLQHSFNAVQRHLGVSIATEGVLKSGAGVIEAGLKKVIEIIKSLWNKLFEFVKVAFDGNRHLIAKAERIKKKLGDKSHNTLAESVSDNRFKHEALAKNFMASNVVDFKVVEDTSVLHSKYAENAKAVNDVISGNIKLMDIGKKMAEEKDLQKLEANKGAVQTVLDDMLGKLLQFMVPGAALSKDAGEQEYVYPAKNQALFGNKQVVVTITRGDADDNGKLGVAFKFDNHQDPKDGSDELEVLSHSEMLEMCDLIVSLGKGNESMFHEVEKAKKSVDKLLTVLDNVSGKVDKVLEDTKKEAKKEKEEEKKENVSTEDADVADGRVNRKLFMVIRQAVSAMATKSGAFAGAIAGMNVKLGKSMLTYVIESDKLYTD